MGLIAIPFVQILGITEWWSIYSIIPNTPIFKLIVDSVLFITLFYGL